jgi:hypothetical protein
MIYLKWCKINFKQIFKCLKMITGRDILTQSWIFFFFCKNEIVRQNSFPNTSQQNRIAQRKNRHLLEVAKTLLFLKKLFVRWNSATYLIKKKPSKVLNCQTQTHIFKEYFLVARISNDLTVKIFGCTTFIHEHRNINKLYFCGVLSNPWRIYLFWSKKKQNVCHYECHIL